jgi:hypothetical protein
MLWSRAGHAQPAREDAIEAAEAAPEDAIEAAAPAPADAIEAAAPAPELERQRPRGIGARMAVMQPLQKGRRFDALVGVSFDSRIELAEWLVELGLGYAAPLAANDGSLQTVGTAAVLGEVGLGRRLFEARLSPYVGIGVQPRGQYLDGVWHLQVASFGQVGVDFAVRPTMRVFVDLRVAKHVVAVHAYRVIELMGSKYVFEDSRPVYPTEVGIQGGVQF